MRFLLDWSHFFYFFLLEIDSMMYVYAKYEDFVESTIEEWLAGGTLLLMPKGFKPWAKMNMVFACQHMISACQNMVLACQHMIFACRNMFVHDRTCFLHART